MRSDARRRRAERRGWVSFRAVLAADRRANPRDPKAQLVLTSVRVCQLLMGDLDHPRTIALPAVVLHRAITEMLLGLEIRPRTRIGGGLRLYHGFGIVLNDHAVLGEGVILRNGVTVGHREPGGGCPRIGDGVEFGVNAVALGDITIGRGARIGAGAVVLQSIPAGALAVGVPARVVEART